MAIVTKGRTFVSGEIVTPTKLNTLVDSATVTQIVPADLSSGGPTWDESGNVSMSSVVGPALTQIQQIAAQRALILG